MPDSVSLDLDPRVSISNKCPGNIPAAITASHLDDHWPVLKGAEAGFLEEVKTIQKLNNIPYNACQKQRFNNACLVEFKIALD